MITRTLIATALLVIVASAWTSPAAADPYRWCAHYSGEGGNGTNCYFMTIQQCRATVSGAGGYCAPNPFYDGLPIETPTPRVRRR